MSERSSGRSSDASTPDPRVQLLADEVQRIKEELATLRAKADELFAGLSDIAGRRED